MTRRREVASTIAIAMCVELFVILMIFLGAGLMTIYGSEIVEMYLPTAELYQP